MESLSQWELCDGNLEGELIYWGLRETVKEGSGNGVSLSMGAL